MVGARGFELRTPCTQGMRFRVFRRPLNSEAFRHVTENADHFGDAQLQSISEAVIAPRVRSAVDVYIRVYMVESDFHDPKGGKDGHPVCAERLNGACRAEFRPLSLKALSFLHLASSPVTDEKGESIGPVRGRGQSVLTAVQFVEKCGRFIPGLRKSGRQRPEGRSTGPWYGPFWYYREKRPSAFSPDKILETFDQWIKSE